MLHIYYHCKLFQHFGLTAFLCLKGHPLPVSARSKDEKWAYLESCFWSDFTDNEIIIQLSAYNTLFTALQCTYNVLNTSPHAFALIRLGSSTGTHLKPIET